MIKYSIKYIWGTPIAPMVEKMNQLVVGGKYFSARRWMSVFSSVLIICSCNGPSPDEAKDLAEIRELALQGNAAAQTDLAEAYFKGQGVVGDPHAAIALLRKAADQGYADAQFMLSTCYGQGICVSQDWAQEVYWLRKAAEQGHAKAQFNLSNSYELGLGVAKDPRQARYWLSKSAATGMKEAVEKQGRQR